MKTLLDKFYGGTATEAEEQALAELLESGAWPQGMEADCRTARALLCARCPAMPPGLEQAIGRSIDKQASTQRPKRRWPAVACAAAAARSVLPPDAALLWWDGRWWLSTGKTELDGEDLDRLVSIEAALNVGEDLSSRGMRGDLDRRVRAALKVVDLRPRSGTSEDVVNYLLEGAELRGEWARRIRFADDVESLPAPLRVEFDFQANVRTARAVNAGL